MASKFINIVTSGAIANGASVVVPHLLNRDDIALLPDIYAADRGGFTISVDDTNVTFTNNSGGVATCRCYVRWDHSIQRVYGAESTQTLAGFPFDIAGSGTAGVGVTLAQAYLNGPAGGQIIPLNVTQDGIYIRHVTGILGQVALAVQNAGGTATFMGVVGSVTDDAAVVGLSSHVAISAIAGSSAAVTSETLLVTGAANTGITASTEVSQARFNFAQTRTWATGALALQRTVRVDAETLAFVAASTVTDAVTLAISGPPIAGANATITQPWAAWFGGKVFIGDTTPTTNNMLTIYNTGDIYAQIRTASAGGSAHFRVTNEGGAEGFFSIYGSAVAGSTFGLLNASNVFLFSARAIGIGTTAAVNLALATDGIPRMQLRSTAEGAKVTSVDISENSVLKAISIGANDSGGAGFSVLRVPN